MKNYRTLDAIVVSVSLTGVLAGGVALVFIDIPGPNLPIFAAVLSGSVVQLLNSYAGARWGNKKSDEPSAPGTASVSLQVDSTPAGADA